MAFREFREQFEDLVESDSLLHEDGLGNITEVVPVDKVRDLMNETDNPSVTPVAASGLDHQMCVPGRHVCVDLA